MLFQHMTPWLLLCAGMLLALRALPLVIAARRHGWRIALWEIALWEDEETRWQRRSRERALWRVRGRQWRREDDRWRGTRIPAEEANEESATPQVPDITDPAMTMVDWVKYLTTD
jgi:hypothetical protein